MPTTPRGRSAHPPRRQRGFTLIEALVAMLILVFGMLGAAGLMVRAQQAEFESYQRKHALAIVDDFVSRTQANRTVADDCYAITTDLSAGTPYLGTGNATVFA
ncbi:MAG TPA: type IV pilus modification protein PilV, partial [Rubrivivax sp.]